MKVEERCFGIELTPEAEEIISAAFAQALSRVEGHVNHLRVRIMRSGHGIRLRARLWPDVGPTLVVSEAGATVPDVAHRGAESLARALSRRIARHRRRRDHLAAPSFAA